MCLASHFILSQGIGVYYLVILPRLFHGRSGRVADRSQATKKAKKERKPAKKNIAVSWGTEG
jgi:hypothetical protein